MVNILILQFPPSNPPAPPPQVKFLGYAPAPLSFIGHFVKNTKSIASSLVNNSFSHTRW